MRIAAAIIAVTCAIQSFASDTVDVLNVWWETGNYTPDIVTRFEAEGRFDITTNTVHWMKAHPASIDDPYILVTAWQRYGWFHLYWRKNMNSPWIRVAELSNQNMGIVEYRIHMHPKSEATLAILESNGGYFAQNPQNLSIVSSYDRRDGADEHIYRVDLSNFLGTSNTISYADLNIKGYVIGTTLATSYPIILPTPPPTGPPEGPPVPPEPEKKFWLNTNSNTRHNESCRYFENTSAGRYCTVDEGTACRTCGG